MTHTRKLYEAAVAAMRGSGYVVEEVRVTPRETEDQTPFDSTTIDVRGNRALVLLAVPRLLALWEAHPYASTLHVMGFAADRGQVSLSTYCHDLTGSRCDPPAADPAQEPTSG